MLSIVCDYQNDYNMPKSNESIIRSAHLKEFLLYPLECFDSIILFKFTIPFTQFGNKVGKGQFSGKETPTYVYPPELKEVIRMVTNNEDVRDYGDPTSQSVRRTYTFYLPKWLS